MAPFFARRDRWGNNMALWVVVVMTFLIPPAWWSLRQIRLENNVENWLPEHDSQARILEWYRSRFPTEDRVLVTWESSSLEDPRADQLADRLLGPLRADGRRHGGSPYIEQVNTPHGVALRMIEARVDPAEAVRRLHGVLLGSGPLKVRLTDAGRAHQASLSRQLVQLASLKLGVKATVLEPLESMDYTLKVPIPADDPAGATDSDAESEVETISLLAVVGADGQLTDTSPNHDLQISWPGIKPGDERVEQFRKLALELRGVKTRQAPDGEPLVEDCFFVIGAPVAVAVTLNEAGMAEPAKAIDAIRQAATDVGIDEDELHLGGSPVVASTLNREVVRAAWDPSVPWYLPHRRSVILVSSLVGVVLAYVMLRSFRLATLVLVVGVYTTMLAVSIVPVTGGSMNMVLVVMPTLLMVLTLSGSIHVANYWKHAACRNRETAVVAATQMARQPCTLASVTTAVGLASLMSSSLVPVRDFGLYAAVGCLISLAMVLFGLPALLQYWPPRRVNPADVDRRSWRQLGGFLAGHRTAVVVASLAAFGLGTYGLRWFRTETKVIRYFPDEARISQDYRFLEQSLAGVAPVETIIRFDRDAQQELNFLQRLEIVRDVERRIAQHPEISGTLSLADFLPVSPDPPAKDAGYLAKRRYRQRARTTEERVKTEYASEARNFLVVADETTDVVDVRGELLNQRGDELWRISAQVSVMSDLDYATLTNNTPRGGYLDQVARDVLKYYPGTGHVVTGLVPLFLRTQHAVLESLIRSFGLAFVIIAGVMMVVLRSASAGLLVMVPNITPIGLVFGLIAWFGQAVDVGMMITASVALGIAVDGTLHLITWFRTGVSEGMSRREAVVQALGHCGPAMWQTSAVVGLGILMLYPANLLLIRRFGWLMAALIFVALLADIILLPALLAGPLGRMIQKGMTRTTGATESSATEVLSPGPHLGGTAEGSSSPDARKLRVDAK